MLTFFILWLTIPLGDPELTVGVKSVTSTLICSIGHAVGICAFASSLTTLGAHWEPWGAPSCPPDLEFYMWVLFAKRLYRYQPPSLLYWTYPTNAKALLPPRLSAHSVLADLSTRHIAPHRRNFMPVYREYSSAVTAHSTFHSMDLKLVYEHCSLRIGSTPS